MNDTTHEDTVTATIIVGAVSVTVLLPSDDNGPARSVHLTHEDTHEARELEARLRAVLSDIAHYEP